MPGRVSNDGRPGPDCSVAASLEYSTSFDSISVSSRRASLRIESHEAVMLLVGVGCVGRAAGGEGKTKGGHVYLGVSPLGTHTLFSLVKKPIYRNFNST